MKKPTQLLKELERRNHPNSDKANWNGEIVDHLRNYAVLGATLLLLQEASFSPLGTFHLLKTKRSSQLFRFNIIKNKT